MLGFDSVQHGTPQYNHAVVAVFFTVLIWVTLFLRLYVRIVIPSGTRKLNWGDYLIIAACLSSILETFVTLKVLEVLSRPGPLDLQRISEYVKWSGLDAFTLALTTLFTKLSLGLFFLQVLDPSCFRVERITCIVAMIFSLLASLDLCIWSLYLMVNCNGHDPLSPGYLGPKSGCPTTKTPSASQAFMQSAVNIVVDLILTAVPFKVILQTKLHWKAKASGLAVVSLALTATVCAIVRLVYLYKYVQENYRSPRGLSVLLVMVSVEPSMFIVVANLMTLRPLLEKLFPKLKRSYGASQALQYEGQSVEPSFPSFVETEYNGEQIGRDKADTVKIVTESIKTDGEKNVETPHSASV